MFKRMMALWTHRRAARTALSTLSYLYADGCTDLDALGGLTADELHAVCAWAAETKNARVVEVGTLFGLTAREIARTNPGARVIAVDNFCWNPFGLPAAVHESFTRRILKGYDVDVVNCSSADWRARVTDGVDMVFFDASHRYEDVKAECEWAKAHGIAIISGHDYGNPNPAFGVTRAVDEVFGRERIETVGMCWRVRR
jgi:hypothetical protein